MADCSSSCCRYEDKFFDSLNERLDEVLVMRETHVELIELLAANTVDQSVSAAAALQTHNVHALHCLLPLEALLQQDCSN